MNTVGLPRAGMGARWASTGARCTPSARGGSPATPGAIRVASRAVSHDAVPAPAERAGPDWHQRWARASPATRGRRRCHRAAPACRRHHCGGARCLAHRADGIHSRIRAQMHPEQPPINWGGAVMWRRAPCGPSRCAPALVLRRAGHALPAHGDLPDQPGDRGWHSPGQLDRRGDGGQPPRLVRSMRGSSRWRWPDFVHHFDAFR